MIRFGDSRYYADKMYEKNLIQWLLITLRLAANKSKVLHGIAQEPDLGVVLPEDDPEDEEEKDKPKAS